MPSAAANKRIILLSSSLSYRAEPFRDAARNLGLDVTLGLDMPDPLAEYWSPTLPVDFKLPQPSAERIFAFAKDDPVAAIIPVDDGATLIAALASEMLDLSFNSPQAAYTARNKHAMREALAREGVPSPAFRLVSVDDDPRALAQEVSYPCVVKPTMLSGSQGVIRADNAEEFVRAFERAAHIARFSGGENDENVDRAHLLIEDFIPGFEVALEGILLHGQLQTLSLFDKPDPLDGPFFEETIYVTPSRLPAATQEVIAACAAQACRAIGLREGPVHAELRLNERGPWVVEVAGRSIGGLWAKTLRFGPKRTTLEELILRRALGMSVDSFQRETTPGGVMMIPIPGAGILKRVDGLDEARAVPGIEEIDITIHPDNRVTPLPEGNAYLGFIFARGETPQVVETALREAHSKLRFTVAPDFYLARA